MLRSCHQKLETSRICNGVKSINQDGRISDRNCVVRRSSAVFRRTFSCSKDPLHKEGNLAKDLAQKVLAYRWVIFWIMALAYVVVYFHRLSPAVVALDLQTAFQTSGGFMGLLASAYFYPYAVMQFPAGLLSDSLGPRKTVTIFLVIAACGSFAFGMTQNVEEAVLARIFVGLGVSMVFIPAMKVLSQWFRVSEFAYMVALMNVMGGIGALSAATPLAFMTSHIGWRMSFELIGLVTLVMAVLVWITVRNRPTDMGWPSIAQIDNAEGGPAPTTQVIGLLEGAKKVVTEKYFWPLAIWFFLVCGIFFGFGGLWAGPYLMHTYGMDKGAAGSVLNMIAVGMILGSPFLSYFSNRVVKSRKKTLVISTAGLVCLMLFLYFYNSGLPEIFLYMFIFLFAITSSAIVVIGFTTTKELFPVEIAGTSVGTINLFPFLGGAIFQPMMGRILDSYARTDPGVYPLEAYSAMIMALLAASVCALLATFFVKETI